MNICIFGDSITWGARLPFRVGWANLLRNYLDRHTEDYYSVYDLGIDGDTTNGLLNRFEVESNSRSPEVIIFAIGTNDSVFRIKEKNTEINLLEFERNLENLINKSSKFTKKIIFVGLSKGDDKLTCPIPRSSTGKSYSKKVLLKYDLIIEKVAKKYDMSFVDIKKTLVDSDFDDGLHPNKIGHKKIFKNVLFAIKKNIHLTEENKLIVVDTQNNICGFKHRYQLTRKDIVRVGALWITNSSNEILISRRAVTKRRDTGKWGPAVAKIIEKGQDYKKSILIALKNELNIEKLDLIEHGIHYINGKNNFFVKWFSSKIDINISDLEINKIETTEIKWVKVVDLLDNFNKYPDKYVQSFDEYLNIFT